jgi:hypothetical protein
MCGVDSRKTPRTKLKKDNVATQQRMRKEWKEHLVSVEAAKQANLALKRRGNVKCGKMPMIQRIQFVSGYLYVYPNFRHKGSVDKKYLFGKGKYGGLNRHLLSPKSLPVSLPGFSLPPCQTLEGMHQGSKWYDGISREEFQANRSEMFAEVEDPKRHSKHYEKGRKFVFVWEEEDGNEHYVDYITCRQFYCNLYERAVQDMPDFQDLQRQLDEGINLIIYGYDGHEVPDDSKIELWYLDPSTPFGHEMVLYTMLKLSEAEWPWRKHKTFSF